MNNLKDIINIEKHNFDNIFGYYSNDEYECANFNCRSHNYYKPPLKMFCKKCNKFVCSRCINKDASQCLTCCKNNNDVDFKCNSCDTFFNMICWICGKGIYCDTRSCFGRSYWQHTKSKYVISFCSPRCHYLMYQKN